MLIHLTSVLSQSSLNLFAFFRVYGVLAIDPIFIFYVFVVHCPSDAENEKKNVRHDNASLFEINQNSI